ncbi:hypothetical protein JTB14_014805 [Gonioctena quinquepunctata]|nr:hypothetical protein JTB14_014805 [Gonioctena quinquepunctata]KAG5868196.1 hypothetical protein JTB14_014805 [Gonioctena quinquepunctata]
MSYINAAPREIDGDLSTLGSRSNSNETDNFQYTFDKYYFFETASKQTWEEASRQCSDIDMGLAAIETEEENSDLAQLTEQQVGFQTTSFWTSGKRTHGQWLWTRINSPLTYTNWNSGEPRKKKDCLEAVYENNNNKLTWSAQDCDLEKLFICEKYGN